MLIETAGLKCLGPPIIWLQPSLVLYKEFVNIQKKFPLKAGKKKKSLDESEFADSICLCLCL